MQIIVATYLPVNPLVSAFMVEDEEEFGAQPLRSPRCSDALIAGYEVITFKPSPILDRKTSLFTLQEASINRVNLTSIHEKIYKVYPRLYPSPYSPLE